VSGWFPTGRRIRVLLIATAILVIGATALLARGDDNGADPTDAGIDRPPSVTPIEANAEEGSTPTDQTTPVGPNSPSSSQPTPSASSSADATSADAAPSSPDASTIEASQPSLPKEPIPRSDEASTCRAIVERLAAYRDLAVNEPVTSLLTLQLGLDEFEGDVDFLSEGREWGVVILEHLVVVRRDWSTAYSAYYADDRDVVEERMASALSNLDAAIEAPCP
jgi:hypothetical protein